MGRKEYEQNNSPQENILDRFGVDSASIPDEEMRQNLVNSSRKIPQSPTGYWKKEAIIDVVSDTTGLKRHSVESANEYFKRHDIIHYDKRLEDHNRLRTLDDRGLVAFITLAHTIRERLEEGVDPQWKYKGIEDEVRTKLGEDNYTLLFGESKKKGDEPISFGGETEGNHVVIEEIPERQQEASDEVLMQTKEVRGGIPVLSQKALIEDLPTWTTKRLQAISQENDSRVLASSLNRDVIAAVEFVTSYVSQNFHDYNPFPVPEEVNVREFQEKLEVCSLVIESLRERFSHVTNLADLYKGFISSAKEEGFKEIRYSED